MNKSKLKNRILYKPTIKRKLVENDPFKGLRRGKNFIYPDTETSSNNNFSDIFGVDDDLQNIKSSQELYENIFSDEKEKNN